MFPLIIIKTPNYDFYESFDHWHQTLVSLTISAIWRMCDRLRGGFWRAHTRLVTSFILADTSAFTKDITLLSWEVLVRATNQHLALLIGRIAHFLVKTECDSSSSHARPIRVTIPQCWLSSRHAHTHTASIFHSWVFNPPMSLASPIFSCQLPCGAPVVSPSGLDSSPSGLSDLTSPI